MPDKVHQTAADTFSDLIDRGILHDGASIMVGGFGLCGIPEHLIAALRDTGVKDLTVISNNAGVDDWGLGLLLQTRQIRKMVSSYVGENSIFEKQFIDGELEVEFNPQGNLAERIRAGGAGIPAFFTATGAGTAVAEGKETRAFYRPADDTKFFNRHPSAVSGPNTDLQKTLAHMPTSRQREYVLETGLFADLALVKAWRADPMGNLQYRKTARNFNPMMATAARFVIAEVDETVETGSIDPDQVHTPGSYIDRVVQTESVKRIEQRTVASS